MVIERMTAEEYRAYKRGEAPSYNPVRPVGDVSIDAVAWVGNCTISAQDMPAVDEAAVGAECLAVLAEHGAVLLEHVPEGEFLKRGQLAYVTSEHKAKPRGISRGWPDWHLWRVGYWQQGVELKARERKGRHARMSREQQLACAADLYRPVWAGQHLSALIAALDAAAGFERPTNERS